MARNGKGCHYCRKADKAYRNKLQRCYVDWNGICKVALRIKRNKSVALLQKAEEQCRRPSCSHSYEHCASRLGEEDSGNVEVAHTHRFKKAYLRHLLKEHYEHSRYHIEGGYGYHKRQYYYNIYIKQLQPIEEQIVGAVYRERGEACGIALRTAGSVIGRISGRTAKGCNSISLKICGELLQSCEILSVGEGL